ncbi:M28 family peptidase [Aliikangiella coralliicola]|uniref:M28 family peptidase n=1 Tax=Aliikangiella coralliicola TaxID=2592383 RepID=A0A545UHA5_9GAMM|nr:M28 family peptidase [Aliikangiella coralliicola]TQV88856.1 M28 family peptidase [Aliikangiella coralliicola]
MNRSLLANAFKIVFRISLIVVICLVIIGLAITRPTFVTQEPDLTDDYVSADNLKKHVIFLSETSVPRSNEYPENLNSVANYIKEKLSLSTDDVSFQSYVAGAQTYKNVIAKFGPTSGDLIIIGAHYDAYAELPGADDNASGVAGLIELGRLLKTVELSSQVLLVAYSLEEPPYFASKKMGSYVHASSLRAHTVKMMISLEMIGYFSEEEDSQSFPVPLMGFVYPDRGNFIAVVDRFTANNAAGLKSVINQYTDLSAYSINAPASVTGVDFSDHRNYWAFGFPAIMVTDTAFFRNRAYHTVNDTYDKLNYKAMAKVVFGVFKYVQKIDNQKK